MGIADFLPLGAENGIPLRHLIQLTGIPSRDLRRRIQAERLMGVPILSDCQHGYFLAETPREVDAFVKSMRRRAGEITRVAEAVEKAVLQ